MIVARLSINLFLALCPDSSLDHGFTGNNSLAADSVRIQSGCPIWMTVMDYTVSSKSHGSLQGQETPQFCRKPRRDGVIVVLGVFLEQNAFLGKRVRRRVKMKTWMKASNSLLFMNPQILN